MDKIDLTKLCDGDLGILLLDVRREMKRRENAAAENKNVAVVRGAYRKGTLVGLLMEQVSEYWHDEFMEAFDAFARRNLPIEFHEQLVNLIHDAGSLSNDRDEIERGKFDEADEEQYERDCTQLEKAFRELLAHIPK